MVKAEDFKSKIKQIIQQDYQIEFLGQDFDQIANLISENQAEKIYQWISQAIQKKIQPLMVGSKKPYKDWSINELLVFRYPFTINNSEYRILFVKVKNSIYIEFHLGDHKYYDKVRKDLDLKKSSY